MDRAKQAVRGVAEEVAKSISAKQVIGLGSGSTVAAIVEELSPILLARHEPLRGVPTSTQIEMVAGRSGVGMVPFPGRLDLVIDGADQVDSKSNLIKGGGGALLKEKVLMAAAAKVIIVASEEKFSQRLCENGVKVPVEVYPFAREPAKRALSRLGGLPSERLLSKGYPYFTENGNIVLDTAFEPIEDPEKLEREVKCVPGVAEVGIFTIKPITVFRLHKDGSFDSV